jgi:hypothetical protein
VREHVSYHAVHLPPPDLVPVVELHRHAQQLAQDSLALGELLLEFVFRALVVRRFFAAIARCPRRIFERLERLEQRVVGLLDVEGERRDDGEAVCAVLALRGEGPLEKRARKDGRFGGEGLEVVVCATC